MESEFGRAWGVVFVGDDGKPMPPHDPSRCPACGKTRADGTWWDTYVFGPYGGIARWNCPCGSVWTV